MSRLLDEAHGGEVLDLGCGDGAVARLAAGRLSRYVGVDLAPPAGDGHVQHDLREGLGPVGTRPFDLYLGTFGIASHLSPAQLRRLLGDVAAHARAGALVAIEALGRESLEWPQLWEHGARRGADHPLQPGRRRARAPVGAGRAVRALLRAGIEPLRAIDRTLQAGPKSDATGRACPRCARLSTPCSTARPGPRRWRRRCRPCRRARRRWCTTRWPGFAARCVRAGGHGLSGMGSRAADRRRLWPWPAGGWSRPA